MESPNRNYLGFLVAGLIGLIIGYFAGREHLKYEVRTAMKSAADEIQKSFASASAPAAAAPVVVTKTVAFEVTGAITVGALMIEVAYKGPGRLIGDADGVACETLIEGALSSYNHIAAEKTLKAAYVAVKGFTGPARFAKCKYEGTAAPADFKVLVKDASTPDLTEILPAPVIKVVVE